MKKIAAVILAVFLWATPGWSRVYFSPGPDCTEAIVSRVQASRGPIYVLAYNFTSLPVLAALKGALQRGVKVVAIVDYRANFTDQRSIARPLAVAGALVAYDRKHPISHSKEFLFPTEGLVLTGSFNFSAQAERNHENLLEVTAPEDVAAYLKDFFAHLLHCVDGEGKPVGGTK